MGERNQDETTVLALIEEEDFQGAANRLLVVVAQLQEVVESLIYMYKSVNIEADVLKTLWNGEKEKNKELLKMGKEAIASFQEREIWLAASEEGMVELTCSLRMINDVVSDTSAKSTF